jgi:hypothetical protein
MSDDIFDRALDRRNALIKEQRRRIKALEAGVSDAIAYVEFQRPNAVDLDQLLLALRNLLKGADQ